MEKLSLGLWGSGGHLSISDGMLSFRSSTGTFRVPMRDITTVTLDAAKHGHLRAGRRQLTIVGVGTTLASIELPGGYGERAQDWVLARLERTSRDTG